MSGVVSLARRYLDRLEHPDYEPIPEDVWELTVPEIFAWRARQQPGALAVTDGTRAFTYAELDAASNRLAHALLEVFPHREHRVPLILGRQAVFAVGMLAGMKAGRAYAALESSYPLVNSNRF